MQHCGPHVAKVAAALRHRVRREQSVGGYPANPVRFRPLAGLLVGPAGGLLLRAYGAAVQGGVTRGWKSRNRSGSDGPLRDIPFRLGIRGLLLALTCKSQGSWLRLLGVATPRSPASGSNLPPPLCQRPVRTGGEAKSSAIER